MRITICYAFNMSYRLKPGVQKTEFVIKSQVTKKADLMADFEAVESGCRITGYALYDVSTGKHYTLTDDDKAAGLSRDTASGDLLLDFTKSGELPDLYLSAGDEVNKADLKSRSAALRLRFCSPLRLTYKRKDPLVSEYVVDESGKTSSEDLVAWLNANLEATDAECEVVYPVLYTRDGTTYSRYETTADDIEAGLRFTGAGELHIDLTKSGISKDQNGAEVSL